MERNLDWGGSIWALLQKHGLSQRAASEKTDFAVSHVSLSDWIKGKVPKYNTAIAFLRYFPDEAAGCLDAAGYTAPSDWNKLSDGTKPPKDNDQLPETTKRISNQMPPIFAYSLSLEKDGSWTGIGKEPTNNDPYHSMGFLMGNTILFHTQKFTEKEFRTKCENALSESVKVFASFAAFNRKSFVQVGENIAGECTFLKEELAAAIYNALINEEKFFVIQQAAQVNIHSDVHIKICPEDDFQTPGDKTIISKFKVWLYHAICDLKDKMEECL